MSSFNSTKIEIEIIIGPATQMILMLQMNEISFEEDSLDLYDN